MTEKSEFRSDVDDVAIMWRSFTYIVRVRVSRVRIRVRVRVWVRVRVRVRAVLSLIPL